MPKSSTIVRTVVGGVILAPLMFLIGSPVLDAQAPAPGQPAPGSSEQAARDAQTRHPLDPLDSDEIRLAVDTVRKERKLAESVRFVTVSLNEPPKSLVLHRKADQSIAREAFLVLLDNATGTGYESVVKLGARSVSRFDALGRGVQPSITLDEFTECEEAARKCPLFRDAMKKRGIEDMSLVMVDAWSAAGMSWSHSSAVTRRGSKS